MKKIIICTLCITILILSIPVSASADDESTSDGSLMASGVLATSAMATAAGLNFSASVANYGYDIQSAISQVYANAVANGSFQSALSSIVSTYPTEAAAAASAVGVSSLTTASASQLTAAVGSATTISAGVASLAILAALIAGAAIYYGMVNSVEIPDYGTRHYSRWGDFVFGSVGDYVDSSNFGYYYNIAVAGASALALGGITHYMIDGHDVTFNFVHSLTTENNNWEGHYWNHVFERGDPFFTIDGVDYTMQLYYSMTNGFPGSISLRTVDSTPPDKLYFCYDNSSYDGRFASGWSLMGNGDAGFSSGMYIHDNTYGTSDYSVLHWCLLDQAFKVLQTVDESLTAPVGTNDTVINKWRLPDSLIPVPGFPGVDIPTDGIVLEPTVDGIPGWTSPYPDQALEEYEDAVDNSYEREDEGYIPLTNTGIRESLWNPDADWTNEGNPDPTDGNNPESSPIIPTGGILVPWHYVVRMLEDASVGLQTYYTLITAMIPTFVLNIFYALLVLFILFGVLHRFLK